MTRTLRAQTGTRSACFFHAVAAGALRRALSLWVVLALLASCALDAAELAREQTRMIGACAGDGEGVGCVVDGRGASLSAASRRLRLRALPFAGESGGLGSGARARETVRRSLRDLRDAEGRAVLSCFMFFTLLAPDVSRRSYLFRTAVSLRPVARSIIFYIHDQDGQK